MQIQWKRAFIAVIIVGSLALIIALSGCASYPFQGWTRTHTVNQALGTALEAADWSQSRWIAAHRQDRREFNPMIGNKPTDSDVNAYFLATGLVRLGVASMLKDPYRTWAQYFFIGGSAAVVGHNVGAGIGMKW